MQERDIVVLIGSSLLMDTVEASLAQQQSLEVIRIHTDDVNWRKCISLLGPDLVLFDWGLPCSEALSILRDRPGLPLIGLAATTQSVIALSSRHYAPTTSNDLADLIHTESCRVSGDRGNGAEPTDARSVESGLPSVAGKRGG